MLDDNDENGPAWGDRDYTYEEVCICVKISFVAFLRYCRTKHYI